MKTNFLPEIVRSITLTAVALAAFTFATSASAQNKPVGDDGIAASPKVRQMLNERNAATAPAVAAAPAMACPKCADVRTSVANPQAKTGELLAGTANKAVVKHTCSACQTTMSLQGEGKAKHQVATHTCSADVPKPAGCCGSN